MTGSIRRRALPNLPKKRGSTPRPAVKSRPRPAAPRARPIVPRKPVIQKVGRRGPLPAAPSRRPMQRMPIFPSQSISGAAAGAASLEAARQAQMIAEVNQIRNRYANLEAAAQLSDIYEAIGHIDARLLELPTILNQLRDRHYVHSGELENQLTRFDEEWDIARVRLEDGLKEHVHRLQEAVDQSESIVAAVSRNQTGGLGAAKTAVMGLERQIQGARSGLQGLYRKFEQQLSEIDRAIKRVDMVLDAFESSQEILLNETEGPLAIVEAEWREDGEEGPEGLLLLTDQRLFFEQRELLETKKFFGMITTKSEKIQKLKIAVMVHDIEMIKHRETGGFLGLGKEDVLELIFTANAPFARADFNIKNGRSSVWATLLKKVQTGGIDGERAEAYVEEINEAEALQAIFPTKCPSCFAPVLPPVRGVTNLICDFCGTVVTAQKEKKVEQEAEEIKEEK